MKQMELVDRSQIQMMSLEDMVSIDSTVRVIDLFLDYALDHNLEFKTEQQSTGRPAYPVKTMLGIYIYGYLNRIRSSRQLEKACQTNVELWWLLGYQMPCFKTIANFRKDNRKGFRNLFKCFREFCNGLELYGKTTVAIDGSKFRAQNSKKNNYNEKKLNRHLEYIDKKTEEYLTTLDEQDREEGEENPATHQRLKDLAERRVKYKELKEELERREELQISTTDPDARALPLHMKIVEVGYNVQSSVDDKHNLVVEYEVTNEKDDNALAPMVFKSKAALGMQEADPLTALADKGYHKGEQLEKCQSKSIDTLVAPKEYVDNTKPENLRKEKFVYDKESDTYTCPNGEILKKQKRYHRRKKGKIVSSFDRYTIRYSVCVTCPHYEDCISPAKKKQSQGRCIDRFEYQDAIDRNKEEVTARKEEYRRRQAIVEHPFGTIKRQWGYSYTLLKTIRKVETEFSIIFLCYNLRRAMSILGLEGLKEALKIDIFSIIKSVTYVTYHKLSYLPKTRLLLSSVRVNHRKLCYF